MLPLVSSIAKLFRAKCTPGVTLISAPAGFGKTTMVFAPSRIDIIEGIIKVTIDEMIQRLASKY
jgi:hypothetical protein